MKQKNIELTRLLLAATIGCMTNNTSNHQDGAGQQLQDRILECMQPGAWYSVRQLVDLVGGARSSVRDRLEKLRHRNLVTRADSPDEVIGLDATSLPAYMAQPADEEGFPKMTADAVVASAIKGRGPLDLAWASIATPVDQEALVREYMSDEA